MSVAVADADADVAVQSPRYQPFQCHICHGRFTRRENLKRHAASHSRAAHNASLPCALCQATFSRLDLRKRHMKRKHPGQVENLVVERLQRDSALVTESAREGGTRSASPSVIPCDQEPQRPLTEVEREVDYRTSHIDLLQTQRQLHQDDRDHLSFSSAPGLAQSAAINAKIDTAHRVANWLTRRPSTSETGVISPVEQDMIDSEQSLLLETSSLNNSHFFNDHFQPATGMQVLSPGNTSNHSSSKQYLPDGLSSRDISYLQDNWSPSPSQTARGYQLYFSHVSHFVPFLHRPTFDATEVAPHMGLSMLCLAYQHGEDPDCSEQAGSGARLSLRCFHRARVFAASGEEMSGGLSNKITLIQAYWLLQVYVMMYLCGEDSSYGFKMHSRMISLTRAEGLTQPLSAEFATTEDLEGLWREFIKAESYKRTLLAVHQLDALWYQLFSIPRSLSHLEVKHDLPCPESFWTALSSAQWAHRQLAAGQSAPLIPYSEAVRIILSPDPDIDSLPTFDLYGAINIAQFLLSSVREVSGWSTMTGRVSLERFEPLRTSLIALERLIRPRAETPKSTHALSFEATWEMAMIELLIWSPSHTCGIVGGSVDTFLSQSTYLASACQTSHEAVTAEAVQPHTDWFLRYLDTTLVIDSEPPWVALYVYKAFLIAWQLVREGLPEAMQVVGVEAGDVHGAISWARIAFGRRQRWQLSRLILSCLDILEGQEVSN